MPTIMKLLGWKSENLRCPDHEIDLCTVDGEPNGISLIQMPNGTGKTTTLTLLRAALSGSAQGRTWDAEKIKEFRKRGGNGEPGRFEVRLALNDKRVTIIMSFDFDNGIVSYKTTRGDGQVVGFDPPHEFRRFMSENFVNFYVFDGELAQNLLDRDHTDAQVVVEQLFQINTLQKLQQKVIEYWDRETQNASATEERGLARRRNRLVSLRAHLHQLKRQQAQLQVTRDQLKGQLEAQQQAYDQEIHKEEHRAQQVEFARVKVAGLESQVKSESTDLLNLMADPHALSSHFATAMHELKTGLDRVKLPESAAREFFEELADESECICGRPIDLIIREVIRTRAGQYLGTDDVSLLNSMKTAIAEAAGSSLTEPEAQLKQKIRALETFVQEARIAQNELSELQFEAEQSDPAVKQAKNEIDRLRALLGKVEEQLARFEDKDDSLDDERTYGIAIMQRRIADAEAKLAEITKTIELKAKRDILARILGSAHRKAKLGVTTELCSQANARIHDLMPYNNISIARIDQSLVLSGQGGGSVGEQLSVAYAFLATLFHRSEHQLPFIVDSPAGPIDLAVRPKIGELVPKLSNQFVAFTISSEREGFVKSLQRASARPVQFITLFRRGSPELETKARATGAVSETKDGMIVTGEGFFNDFQLDEEEVYALPNS